MGEGFAYVLLIKKKKQWERGDPNPVRRCWKYQRCQLSYLLARIILWGPHVKSNWGKSNVVLKV